jgi:nucleoid-associated protein YgaU
MPIMRKDVKLGLAVGGVLLAVLVVYVLVVPGNNTNQVGATLENLDGSESQATSGDTAGAAPNAVASSGNGGAAEGATGGASTDTRQAAGNGSRSPDAGTGAGATGANSSANTGEKATAGGGWNWDALVNGTEKVPSLAAGTDVVTNTALAANGGSVGNGATAGNGTSAAHGGTTGAGSSGVLGDGNDATAVPNTAGDLPANATATGSSSSARQNVLAGGAQAHTNAPTTPSATGARTHVVKAGDTFSKISLAAYGTSKHYAQIEHANPGIDPTRLKLGQTINLPAIDAKPAGSASASAAGATATIDPRSEYKVQPNDSLYTISLRLYGKADRVEKIYELNKAAIGDDMARVKVGMVLKLPEPPTQTTAAASSR